jgi:hypothetical protein
LFGRSALLGDLDAAAAIAGEATAGVMLGRAGNRPPALVAVMRRAQDELLEFGLPDEDEGQSSPTARVRLDEKLSECRAEQRFAVAAEQPRNSFREIGQSPVLIGRPQPPLAGVLEILEEEQRLFGIARTPIGGASRAAERGKSSEEAARLSHWHDLIPSAPAKTFDNLGRPQARPPLRPPGSNPVRLRFG